MNASMPPSDNKVQTEKPHKPGLLANLLFNIVIPTLIMTKLSGDDRLGPLWSIVVALVFPVGYGIKDYFDSHKPNFFSALGVISVLLTGTMSLLKLPPEYIAIKEATIPALFGLATIFSLNTRYPLVRTFLYNDNVMQIEKVAEALRQNHAEAAFEQRLKIASWMVAGSFFMSSILNYVLAKVILVSEPGTTAFTEELGKMTALSYPVIAIPSTLVLIGALFYLLKGIRQLTALDYDDIFKEV
jgi:hypothetical protein